MTTNKHSPGPLQYAFEGGTVAFILESDGTTVAKLSVTENTTAHAGLAANARLFAASTELLAALQRLTLAAERREYTMGDQCNLIAVKAELADAARQARAAAARAVGQNERDAAITSYYEDRANSGQSALEARP